MSTVLTSKHPVTRVTTVSTRRHADRVATRVASVGNAAVAHALLPICKQARCPLAPKQSGLCCSLHTGGKQ